MRKSNTQKISDVIGEYLRELKIDRKLKEVDLISQWESLMGKMIASRTQKISLKNKILYLQVSSSVLKAELLMMRQDMVNRLNEHAGECIVEQIIIK
jgi:predicted nucleic acid-binding Zn ribbon protein